MKKLLFLCLIAEIFFCDSFYASAPQGHRKQSHRGTVANTIGLTTSTLLFCASARHAFKEGKVDNYWGLGLGATGIITFGKSLLDTLYFHKSSSSTTFSAFKASLFLANVCALAENKEIQDCFNSYTPSYISENLKNSFQFLTHRLRSATDTLVPSRLNQWRSSIGITSSYITYANVRYPAIIALGALFGISVDLYKNRNKEEPSNCSHNNSASNDNDIAQRIDRIGYSPDPLFDSNITNLTDNSHPDQDENKSGENTTHTTKRADIDHNDHGSSEQPQIETISVIFINKIYNKELFDQLGLDDTSLSRQENQNSLRYRALNLDVSKKNTTEKGISPLSKQTSPNLTDLFKLIKDTKRQLTKNILGIKKISIALNSESSNLQSENSSLEDKISIINTQLNDLEGIEDNFLHKAMHNSEASIENEYLTLAHDINSIKTTFKESYSTSKNTISTLEHVLKQWSFAEGLRNKIETNIQQIILLQHDLAQATIDQLNNILQSKEEGTKYDHSAVPGNSDMWKHVYSQQDDFEKDTDSQPTDSNIEDNNIVNQYRHWVATLQSSSPSVKIEGFSSSSMQNRARVKKEIELLRQKIAQTNAKTKKLQQEIEAEKEEEIAQLRKELAKEELQKKNQFFRAAIRFKELKKTSPARNIHPEQNFNQNDAMHEQNYPHKAAGKESVCESFIQQAGPLLQLIQKAQKTFNDFKSLLKLNNIVQKEHRNLNKKMERIERKITTLVRKPETKLSKKELNTLEKLIKKINEELKHIFLQTSSNSSLKPAKFKYTKKSQKPSFTQRKKRKKKDKLLETTDLNSTIRLRDDDFQQNNKQKTPTVSSILASQEFEGFTVIEKPKNEQ